MMKWMPPVAAILLVVGLAPIAITRGEESAPPPTEDAQGESAPANGAGETPATRYNALDTVWVLMTAFLVFFMQAGFGMVEAGLIRAKNACNILMKNLLDFCMSSIGFFMFGYAIMFGTADLLFGTEGWFLFGATTPEAYQNLPLYAFWMFQTVFCGAAATIVAGGVAERIKFAAYLMYSFVISAFIYPVIGHWIWGGGWLSRLGFYDFAGSTVVHAVGGFTALVGTYFLGPRIGKYRSDGSASVISGHNIPLVSLGVFLLWFGWFGFNPGSTLSLADPEKVARIAVTTNLAAASGAISSMIFAWLKFKKPDFGLTMNGVLAGLVAITAGCASVSPGAAILIGAVAGVLSVLGVIWLDRLHLDDPVGAVPVHGLNGLWGTLAVGLFGQTSLDGGLAASGLFYGGGVGQLGIQALGSITAIVTAMVSMAIVFKAIDAMIGLRVSPEEEIKGLDIGEHGMESYAGFQIFTTE